MSWGGVPQVMMDSILLLNKIKIKAGIKCQGRKEQTHSKCSLSRSASTSKTDTLRVGWNDLFAKLYSRYEWDTFKMDALIKIRISKTYIHYGNIFQHTDITGERFWKAKIIVNEYWYFENKGSLKEQVSKRPCVKNKIDIKEAIEYNKIYNNLKH